MDEMTELEDSLRQGLRHVPAPEGFAGRVMARVAGGGAGPVENTRRTAGTLLPMHPAAAWWSAAAAALLLAVGGGDALHIRHQHEVQREHAAEAQVDLAMQLTNHALNEVELNLDRSHAGKFTHLWNESQQ